METNISPRYYTNEGLWAQADGKRVRIGLSDFLQQRSGDVAFVEVKAEGKSLAAGDEVAVIETIKVNISLASPVKGKVIEINPARASSPEAINQDPYGEGRLAILEADAWEVDSSVDEILHYTPVFAFPSLIIAGELVCVGRFPKRDEVLGWLRTAIH